MGIFLAAFLIFANDPSQSATVVEYQEKRMRDLMNAQHHSLCNLYAFEIFGRENACIDGKYFDENKYEMLFVQDTEDDKFIQYSITVAGRAKVLSKSVETGFERHVFVLLFFYSHRLEANHYIYLQEPMMNKLSFTQVLNPNGANTKYIPVSKDTLLQRFQDRLLDIIEKYRDTQERSWR